MNMLATTEQPLERRLVQPPLPCDLQKAIRCSRASVVEPLPVLVPGTRLKLAPHGAAEPRRVILAAEVASQISHTVLTGPSRVRAVVLWRWATYFALLELFPTMSGVRAARIIGRDHTTMLHASEVRERHPSLLEDKIAAILEVFK